MTSLPRHEASSRRIRLAVLRDPREAERLQAGLESAGITAFVEIDDVQHALPGGTLIPGVTAGGSSMFAYPLVIHAADRDRAAAVLIDLGWDGRSAGRRRVERSPRTLASYAL